MSAFRSSIGPKSQVLDIGAGIGEFAYNMANRGAQVRAVSLLPQRERYRHPRVRFDEQPIEIWHTWPNTTLYSHVLMRNVIQFLSTTFVERVLEPWLWNHTQPQAPVAIHTFHRLPEGWDAAQLRSLWTRRDLHGVFHRWTHAMSEQLPGRRCRAGVNQFNTFYSTYALFRRP